MSRKKLSIREQSQLLVQSILNKQTLTANKILDKLIAQAEEQREQLINKLILQQDELDDLEDTDDDADMDIQDGEDTEESSDDLDGEDEELSETDVDNKIDDALQIQCEINAKRITSMFDTIAELKQALDNKGLDANSKEYIKSDVSIQYYSDKLQEFQGKTNPGIDQSKLEEALDKIFEALEQLRGELGVEGAEDVDTDVDTPEEASEDVNDTGDENLDEDEDDEDLDEDENLEEQEDLEL